MFDDNQQTNQANTGEGQPIDPQQQQHNPAAPPPDHNFNPQPAYDSVFDEDPNNAGSLSSDDSPAPATPAANDQSVAPAADANQPTPASAPVSAPAPSDDELLGIKEQALKQLSPLIGQLDQSPEEKFHTTMRIIQASDNHSLIKEAYQAAQQIDDEKVRAQALLDIVNEINYFTKGEGEGDNNTSAPANEPAAL